MPRTGLLQARDSDSPRRPIHATRLDPLRYAVLVPTSVALPATASRRQERELPRRVESIFDHRSWCSDCRIHESAAASTPGGRPIQTSAPGGRSDEGEAASWWLVGRRSGSWQASSSRFWFRPFVRFLLARSWLALPRACAAKHCRDESLASRSRRCLGDGEHRDDPHVRAHEAAGQSLCSRPVCALPRVPRSDSSTAVP